MYGTESISIEVQYPATQFPCFAQDVQEVMVRQFLFDASFVYLLLGFCGAWKSFWTSKNNLS